MKFMRVKVEMEMCKRNYFDRQLDISLTNKSQQQKNSTHYSLPDKLNLLFTRQFHARSKKIAVEVPFRLLLMRRNNHFRPA